MSQPAYADHVQPASALTRDRRGSSRYLPVESHLGQLLPDGALRRGSIVAIATGTPGSTSLMLQLLASASQAGSWVAIAGLPTAGFVAADELGLVLARTAVVPDLGRDPANVIGALVDGFDIVVLAGAQRFPPTVCQQLAARARQRGAVLVPFGTPWDGADATLAAVDAKWYALGEHAGRRIAVSGTGRGSGGNARRTEMWSPPPGVQWTLPPRPPEEGRARSLRSVG